MQNNVIANGWKARITDHNLFYLVLLLLCCLAAYWPLSLHLFSLKNDALNYSLPIRYQISEALYNNQSPFWSPYFNLGYPLHADMLSGVWNPFVRFFSLFGTYSLKTLQIEMLLYIYLSGVGMYFLIKHVIANKRIALWAAVGYMLCGFISESAQSINWICAASFLPFVFLFYHRTIKEASWKQAVLFGFFLYIFFVTAYPADFIIVCYVLLFYLLTHFFQEKVFYKKNATTSIIKTHSIIAIVFILLSLPAIISFYEFLPLSDRGSGTTYEEAMSNPFHPFFLFSYVTPLVGWQSSIGTITDPLSRNSYFGLIHFILFIAAFLSPVNNRLVVFCKWLFFVSLIFSFGEIGGLRPLTYYALPLMDTFRHPANAKIFSIFAACIIAAFFLKHLFSGSKVVLLKKTPFYIAASMMAAIALITIFSSSSSVNLSLLVNAPSIQTLKSSLQQLSFFDLVVLNVLIQIPFLATAYLLFFKTNKLAWVIGASMANCILMTVLSLPFTVVKKDSATYIQNVLNSTQKKGYPLPDLSKSLAENSNGGEKLFNEIGSANMYNKKIGRIDYRITPSNLRAQNQFWHHRVLRDKLLQYPLIYRADTALFTTTSKVFDSSLNQSIVFINDTSAVKAVNQHVKGERGFIEVINFSPTRFDFLITASQPGFYCLFQNYYPRWQLIIDGKKTEVKKTNIAFMGFQLETGVHKVSFQYKMQELIVTYYISMLLFFGIVVFGLAELFKFSFLSLPRLWQRP